MILAFLDLELALLTFLIFPLVFAGSLVFRIVSADAYARTRETIGAITAYLQETLSGIRVVRSFGQEPRHLAPLRRAQRREPRREHDDRLPQRRRTSRSIELVSARWRRSGSSSTAATRSSTAR